MLFICSTYWLAVGEVGRQKTNGFILFVHILNVTISRGRKTRISFHGSWCQIVPQTVCPHRKGSYGKGKRPGVQWRCSPGVRHFSCQFPRKMALMKYPCAFRLRTVWDQFSSSVLSSVCSPMCALLCALICVHSYVCSHMCALICLLSCALICLLLCALICVSSSLSSPPLVWYPFAPSTLFGVSCRDISF